MKVPGKYVVQWGPSGKPEIEFCPNAPALARRLGELWDKHRQEATGRLATWTDVVLYWQAKL